MQKDTVAYKCPACGASLAFNAESQGFDCDYCGGRFTKSELEQLSAKSIEDFPQAEDNARENAKDSKFFSENNRLYICPGCGANIITESELSASAICHYCHSPIVLSGRLSGEYCPDMIIPFVKTREQAIEGFSEWTGKYKKYLAKGFGSPESLAKLKGIYVPYWLADCYVQGMYTAESYKTISSVRRGDYLITQENKNMVVRQGKLEFDRVPADGSLKADDSLMESIEPFDYSGLVDFEMAYLSGHYAEKFDISKEKVYPRIEKRVCDEAKSQFINSVKGYNRRDVKSEFYNVKGIRWKYVMLPMWFLSYNYKGKMYHYVMNGQTGKFGGTLPLNKKKLAFFSFVLPSVIATAIVFTLLAMGWFF